FEAARALAEKGAHVVFACRNLDKGRAAVASVASRRPRGEVELQELDLADLASVERCARTVRERHSKLHLLINNAGVMALPPRTTRDGFEMQLGTNHLGHFALTGRLLPALLAAPDARVVTVSSLAHRFGRIRFADPHFERGRYQRWVAYGQSKLANLLFAFELQRRFEAARADARSLACHPGFASTNLQFVAPRMEGAKGMEWVMKLNNRFIAQPAAEGALPTLYAAVGALPGGEYVGPGGLFEIRGEPRPAKTSGSARDPEKAARLWRLSEEATGVRFDFGGGGAG
ncbi:MAG TPA: oxidoreductase, partial [Polyangiaceae bacterium LLY-WYZ-15_(1-7)]|nr:oxidoreductase [Polyangiaceae bacterium LLY-WYZ-15_(1-7)]